VEAKKKLMTQEGVKSSENKIKTCCPPVFILKAGDVRIPVWPAPPSLRESDHPIFCPVEHRRIVIEKFKVHFHQHPSIPLNDSEGTYLTMEEIHNGAVNEIRLNSHYLFDLPEGMKR
jgi:hypothetical protein